MLKLTPLLYLYAVALPALMAVCQTGYGAFRDLLSPLLSHEWVCTWTVQET